jgi:hypothetical protein
MAVSGGSPSFAALTVTGDATIDGVTVGQGGGNVSTNTTVGASALVANTSGTANTAIGASSLENCTGSNNTAVGRFALQAHTTGSSNTAMGSAVMANNTTGGSNVAIGQQALQANTTASNNTAVGFQALYRNTAAGNTALGFSAGYQITTGTANTALGYYAMGSNGGGITGASNTAVGNVALTSISTGSYNTTIGDQALYSNTTGSNNTAVGYQAGYGLSTQSNNTFLGYTCGASMTGAGNVLLGASNFSGYNGDDQVAIKVGVSGREALYGNIGGGGSFRQYSNSSTWATTSDQRVKENIVEITNGLEKIVALRPVEFDYITNKEHNAGFIAQEFQNVLPDQVKLVKARPEEAELVGEDEIYTIQQNLTPYLVKAIQELKAELDTVKAELAALKG